MHISWIPPKQEGTNLRKKSLAARSYNINKKAALRNWLQVYYETSLSHPVANFSLLSTTSARQKVLDCLGEYESGDHEVDEIWILMGNDITGIMSVDIGQSYFQPMDFGPAHRKPKTLGIVTKPFSNTHHRNIKPNRFISRRKIHLQDSEHHFCRFRSQNPNPNLNFIHRLQTHIPNRLRISATTRIPTDPMDSSTLNFADFPEDVQLCILSFLAPQEQFEKSAAGRAAKAQIAAAAKQSSNANRGEPTLKWQMG
uniref:Uncharacterized protein n=1 Tax=Kalanchoe fedtschenkoi TaxID=63787 RepID=A0A7N0TQC2_KALFE